MNVFIVQASLVWEDVPANLCAFDRHLKSIGNADLIVLPEMFTSGFTMQAKEKVASRYEEVVQRMQVWAGETSALIMGSTIYGEENIYYNRLLAVFPEGEVLHYDKRHCFTMGEENKHFTPGKEPLVFDFRGVKIAPFICYDLRFPVWSRNTVGYDLAVYVANWPATRRIPWQVLLRARAIENQCYVVGVNRVGEDGNGLFYSGDSAVISPKGEELLVSPSCMDSIDFTTLDMDGLKAFRAKFPVLEDRDSFEIKP